MAIVDQLGRPIVSQAPKREGLSQHLRAKIASIQARFDSAITNSQNAKHWAMADALDADSAAAPMVRQTLRNRARYEFANNSFLNGCVKTLANMLIGKGPRLQVHTSNKKLNYFVEAEFAKWAQKINLAAKLRTMRIAKVNDGEAFAHSISNRRLRTPVQLDIRLTEAEQFSHPYNKTIEDRHIDGIEFDEWGNPIKYYRLRYHPGGLSSPEWGWDELPAESVIHWYRADRPGQRRGIPETTPSLPLFSDLRRWELAVLAAAETAADFAAVMYTDGAAGEEADDFDPDDPGLDIERRMYQMLPRGWKMSQLKAEHPSTTFKEFQQCIWGEAVRCICMPYNVAAGNSSGFNFASGRLDSHGFAMALEIDREDCGLTVLDRIYEWWLDEALLIEGYLSGSQDAKSQLGMHSWGWDAAQPVIDPTKQANADLIRLKSGTISREQLLKQQYNVDVDDHDPRSAEDFGFRDVQQYREWLRNTVFTAPVEAMEPEEVDEEEEANA